MNHPSEGENADQHFVKIRLQATSHPDSCTTMHTDTIKELKLHQLAPIVPLSFHANSTGVK